MHEYLKAIGFSGITNKREQDRLEKWVLEAPDRFSVVSYKPGVDLALAERSCGGHAGVAVLGEVDEGGIIVPEYTFPFLDGQVTSSQGRISYEPQPTRRGFMGMCEDDRLGMALIFDVKNVIELIKDEQTMQNPAERSAALSALASDGTVLLPLEERVRVKKTAGFCDDFNVYDEEEEDDEAYRAAMEKMAKDNIRELESIARRIHSEDIFSLVDSFLMPHGMASDNYYFLGDIRAVRKVENTYTKEPFYQMIVESNGFPFSVAIGVKDLQGAPEPGRRLRCHAWFTGEIRTR